MKHPSAPQLLCDFHKQQTALGIAETYHKDMIRFFEEQFQKVE